MHFCNIVYSFQVLLFILLSQLCIPNEIESTFDGSQTESFEISATFYNDFSEKVSIYFDSGSALSHMMNLAPGASAQLRTYEGHLFHATSVTDSSKILSSVTILPNQLEYFFGASSNRALRSQDAGAYSLSVDTKKRMHPAVKVIGGMPSRAMNARFRSLSNRVLDLWFDDGGSGTIQGTLQPGRDTTTNAYEGHVFYYTPANKPKEILGKFTMNKNQVFYLLEDKQYPCSKDIIDYTNKEMAFMNEYLNRTGLHWRSFYGRDGPRPPPKLHMWPANEVGQVHRVSSPEGKWFCDGPASKCQGSDNVTLELEVISTAPKAYIIPNFLSDFEVQAIINIATPRIRASTVGNQDGGGVRTSSTRTSWNTWVGRFTTPVTQSLYLRAADVLNVHESLLNTNTNAEEMQVVHYDVGQTYAPHHDWGVSGYPESRYITLLLYLTDMKHVGAGGETSFPKAMNGLGIKVHPGKGSAVLFYNLLEDGNGDDLSLHEACPVKDGEKWLANFWVWDPKRT